MKQLTVLFIMISMVAFGQSKTNFHSFKVTDIYGAEFDLSTLKGKKVLVVNTASKCGLTPQFKDLEELYKNYKDQNFTIIGFPSNDFNQQDPGSNEEIAEFCQQNYGVTFPMMSKISVKGDSIHPLYKWLTDKELNGVLSTKVTWNFQKFMIDENGDLIDFVSPQKKPNTKEIVDWITNKK